MSTGPRDNRPPEMPAVRTTIVGGRPPGAGTSIGPIPHGMELLVKKAAVDPEFRSVLLARRAEAASEIEGLVLEPAEIAMLNGIPAEQLEAIIAATKVPEGTRRALLGKVTVVALAAVGAVVVAESCTLGIRPGALLSKGIAPDRPPTDNVNQDLPLTAGIRPEDNSGHAAPDTQAASAPSSKPVDLTPNQPDASDDIYLHSRGIRPDRPGHR